MTSSINPGIITDKFEETKAFYTDKLAFDIKVDLDWYCLLTVPDNPKFELAIMVANHPSQHECFRRPTSGLGFWIAIEVQDVDRTFELVEARGAEISHPLKSEPWGDRHFVVVDPNGVSIDILSRD